MTARELCWPASNCQRIGFRTVSIRGIGPRTRLLMGETITFPDKSVFHIIMRLRSRSEMEQCLPSLRPTAPGTFAGPVLLYIRAEKETRCEVVMHQSYLTPGFVYASVSTAHGKRCDLTYCVGRHTAKSIVDDIVQSWAEMYGYEAKQLVRTGSVLSFVV
jgi:hypothetical protein